MKLILIAITLLISFLPATAQEPGNRFSASAYIGSAFVGNNILIGLNGEYQIKKHSFLVGPYFTKTFKSSITTGIHVGYSYLVSKAHRKTQSLIAFDYLYFNAFTNPDVYDKRKSIRHNFNIGYGVRYKLGKQLFALGNIGFGKALIIDRNTENQNEITNEWWGLSIFSRVGIGYKF